MPAWLLSKLAGPIAAGIALLLAISSITLGVKLWIAGHDRDAAVERANTAEANYAKAQANEATLQTAIAATNATLAQMKADADQREATRREQDQAVDRALAKAATSIAATHPGADKCASASDLIKEFAK